MKGPLFIEEGIDNENFEINGVDIVDADGELAGHFTRILDSYHLETRVRIGEFEKLGFLGRFHLSISVMAAMQRHASPDLLDEAFVGREQIEVMPIDIGFHDDDD